MTSLLTLVTEGCAAIVRPRRVFERIPATARLNRWVLVPCLALWGVPYAHVHFRAMEGVWMAGRLSPETVGWRTVTFMLFSVSNWLLASTALVIMSRRGRAFSVGQCEVAACYLWLVWALMPLVDLLHLFGIPRRNVILPLPFGQHLEFMGHAAWLVAGPVLLAEVTVLVRLLRGFRVWLSVLAAVGMLLVGRVGLEPVPIWIWRWLAHHGRHHDVWKMTALCAGAAVGLWIAIRWWCARRPVHLPAARLRTLTVAGACIAAACFGSAGTAEAVTRVWDGGGGDANTATAANWCNGDSGANDDVAPATGDAVRFGGATLGSCVPHATKSATWNIDLGGYTLAGWTMDSGYSGTVTLAIGVIVQGAFTLASGTMSTAGYAFQAYSYAQTGGTFTAGASMVTFNSSGFTKSGGVFTAGTSDFRFIASSSNQNINSGGATFYNLTFSGWEKSVSGTLTVAHALTVENGASLALGANNVNVNGGTISNTGTITASGGTTTVQGTGTVGGSGSTTFYNLTIGGASATTTTASGTITVSNVLTVDTGDTLNGGTATIQLDQSGTGAARPFIVNGTFNENTSTVSYRGSAATDVTVETYYNLTIDKPGGQFLFTLGSSYPVTGVLTLTGTGGNNLLLRSTGAGAWNLTSTGPQVVRNVDVQYSNACGGTPIAAEDSVDSGTNTCWNFGAPQGTGVGYPHVY